MLIQIEKLKRRPRQIVIEEQATDFSVLRELTAQNAVICNDTIRGSLEAARAGDIIEVTGHLVTTVTMPCSRCLMPVTASLDIPVLLCYAEAEADGGGAAGGEVELQREDLGLIPFTGPEIDMRPDLEQEIIMALPQRPLCNESCKGLCPVCGCNLNQDDCDCDLPVFHAGLAALKNFKV
ncbi:MAG: YceD family protein [Desulfuromonadales bacterium]